MVSSSDEGLPSIFIDRFGAVPGSVGLRKLYHAKPMGMPQIESRSMMSGILYFAFNLMALSHLWMRRLLDGLGESVLCFSDVSLPSVEIGGDITLYRATAPLRGGSEVSHNSGSRAGPTANRRS